MKTYLILILIGSALSGLVYAESCIALENGVKTLCNDYSNFKKKDPTKLKNLCSSGDLNMGGMIIANTFSNDGCDQKGAIAKCRLRDFDVTIYFTGKLKDLEKGCKVFKSAEFIKL